MKKKRSNTNTLSKGIALFLFLLISQCSFSQSTYPQRIVIEKDTLILITPDQLTSVNVLILDYKECSELLLIEKEENLRRTQLIASMEKSMSFKDKSIKALEEEKRILNDQRSTIEKNLKRQRLKTKLFTIIGTVAGGGIVYLILK